MKTFTTNRYRQVSPTLIQETGVGISCPFYISLTLDQKKSFLNTFRQIKTKQLGNNSKNKLSQELLETPKEKALGMNEESLKYTLFLSTAVT